MEEPSEGVIAWDSALTVAEDVHSAHISGGAVGVRELAEECGHVVVSNCTGVVDAKGEEGVGKGSAIVERVLGVGEGQVLNRDGGAV